MECDHVDAVDHSFNTNDNDFTDAFGLPKMHKPWQTTQTFARFYLYNYNIEHFINTLWGFATLGALGINSADKFGMSIS
jgi:hypothetical protein